MKALSRKSILVVDDDAAMSRALDKVLREEGARVTTALSGDGGIEHLTREAGGFDLVITDLRMPFVNGKTILHAVKAVFPDLPVMIITAYAGPNTKAEILQQGAAAFLEKPLDSANLLATITLVLADAETKRTKRDAC